MSNVGNPDRIIRALLGLAFVLVPILSGWAVLSGAVAAVGVVLLATAVFGFCPIYALFGLSSKRHPVK